MLLGFALFIQMTSFLFYDTLWLLIMLNESNFPLLYFVEAKTYPCMCHIYFFIFFFFKLKNVVMLNFKPLIIFSFFLIEFFPFLNLQRVTDMAFFAEDVPLLARYWLINNSNCISGLFCIY